MADKPIKYPTRMGKLLAKAAPRAVNGGLPALTAFTIGRQIGENLNSYTPIQKYIAKGVDKVTGLEAKNKKALEDTPIPARKSANKNQSAATKTEQINKRKGGVIKAKQVVSRTTPKKVTKKVKK